jgi:polar amino acid transport system substrate-binding protein
MIERLEGGTAAVPERLQRGGWDANANSRQNALQLAEKLPGSRVLDDRFASTLQTVAVRKGRSDLLAYVRESLVQVKASGFVKSALDRWKVAGVRVAP